VLMRERGWSATAEGGGVAATYILDGLVRTSGGLSLGRTGAPESEGAEGDERDSDGISDVDAVTPREDEEYGIPSVRVEPDEHGSERYRHDCQSSDHDAANLSDLAAGGGSRWQITHRHGTIRGRVGEAVSAWTRDSTPLTDTQRDAGGSS
jgi:hypothetical protein